jgi:hypothetical protein
VSALLYINYPFYELPEQLFRLNYVTRKLKINEKKIGKWLDHFSREYEVGSKGLGNPSSLLYNSQNLKAAPGRAV